MSWTKHLFRNRDESVDREIAFHIAEQIDVNIARGMTPDEARRQAQLDFGGREQVKQSVREVHHFAFLEILKFNLHSAVRFMRRSPSLWIELKRWRRCACSCRSPIPSAEKNAFGIAVSRF